MKMKLHKAIFGVAAGAALLSPAASLQAETVRIAYPNWAEGIAMTHLATAVLEEYLDVDVELTQADPGAIYAAIAEGNQDVMLDAWLPNTHEPYWEEFGDRLDDLGSNFGYGVTGLVVPTYMTEVNSIEDLNDVADELDGKIIGIGTGAGIYRNTNKAIEEYDLQLTQVASSGPAMTAALADAVASKEPIVVTGWKPHWKFGRYDLKVLEDPKGVYPIDGCKTIVRKGFAKEMPVVAQFLINFSLTESHLLDLMLKIDDSDDDPSEVAEEWMEENAALVDSWIPRT